MQSRLAATSVSEGKGSESSRSTTTTMITPWQECCQLIRSFDRKRKLKRWKVPRKAPPQVILNGQSDQVEFIENKGQALYSGTIAQGFLFDYLADHHDPPRSYDNDNERKSEPPNEMLNFCILDDDEIMEENWQPNWSGRVASLK